MQTLNVIVLTYFYPFDFPVFVAVDSKTAKSTNAGFAAQELHSYVLLSPGLGTGGG